MGALPHRAAALAPTERVQRVPRALSAIIMRLLAKTAEQRYQTAAGVERDLRRCLTQWQAEHRIDDFPVGRQDTPDQLSIPERLCGREREVQALLAAFDRVVRVGTPELVLVSGYSGIGKSSVVNELHKALVPARGWFASGKFDQGKRNMPHATLAQAFQNLVLGLLVKSESALAVWREAFEAALGPNGQLVTDVVPELKLIIGEQPRVPDVPPWKRSDDCKSSSPGSFECSRSRTIHSCSLSTTCSGSTWPHSIASSIC